MEVILHEPWWLSIGKLHDRYGSTPAGVRPFLSERPLPVLPSLFAAHAYDAES
jgi:hypothetical protein